MSDTIAAIATGNSRAALGIVRISGPEAAGIIDIVAPNAQVSKTPGKVRRALARNPKTGEIIDEVLCFFAKGPRTATGEDCAEIQGHGGAITLQSLLEATISAGARIAKPGEFTSRAFTNGRIDLTQAEAVVALIGARSKRAARIAVEHLTGSLGSALNQVLDCIVSVRAELEAGLDFPDEDLPLEETKALTARLEEPLSILNAAVNSFSKGSMLTNGASIAIVGPTNAGKSSLLNRLTGEERAIVDEEPGTTRDIVEATSDIGGFPLRLMDTAGLRATENRVEYRGQEKTFSAAENADLVLVVLDGSAKVNLGDEAEEHLKKLFEKLTRPPVIVLNKMDLDAWTERTPPFLRTFEALHISALDGRGIDDLKETIRLNLENDDDGGEIVLTTTRQLHSVSQALDGLENAVSALKNGADPELAAADLRYAAQSLALLFGRSVEEEVMDALFSTFCLGK